MWGYPKIFEKLIEELNKLPTIGPKTAERLAFYIFKTNCNYAQDLVKSIVELKKQITSCKVCNNIAEENICEICRDISRSKQIVCVVESPVDLIAMEKTAVFKGTYYVLMQLLSPLDGIGPRDLNLNRLLSQLKENNVKEVIIATSYSAEGRTTALYLTQLIRPMKIRVSRLAHGVPVGARLGFVDQETLQEAFKERVEMESV